MSKKSANEKLAFILNTYIDNPIKFFTDVLNVVPDEQQTDLILSATQNGCRVMVKSARGTGKTFVISGLALYFLICFKGVNIRVLSPSEQQLKTVFQREIRKHVSKMNPLFADYIEVGAMWVKNKHIPLNECHLVTASVEKPENISGVHETGEGTKQVYLLDEASAIPDLAYSAITGSLGTAYGGGHIIGCSNPQRGKQVFYSDLFEKRPKGWKLLTFTAEKCPMISEKFIEEQRELYGIDGDEYRVSVLGEFPRADGSTFIPASLVDEAAERMVPRNQYQTQPVVVGVDIARSLSGDKSCICVRQGQKVLSLESFKTLDTMEVVARVADVTRIYQVDCIYGDATGVGGPVLDRLREYFKIDKIQIPVIDVVVGMKSSDPLQYANLRTQLWGEMRDWLMSGGDIPDHYELKKELKEMLWGYNGKMAMQLTTKKKLKGLGVDSPDHADSLSMTFFQNAHTIKRINTQPRRIKRSNILWA